MVLIDARGLASILLGHGVESGRVVDGEYDAEPDALEEQARDQRGHALLAGAPTASVDAGGRQDQEAGDERDAAADAVEGAAGSGPARMIGMVAGISAIPAAAGLDPDHEQQVERASGSQGPSSIMPARNWLMFAARKLRWRNSRNSSSGFLDPQLDR